MASRSSKLLLCTAAAAVVCSAALLAGAWEAKAPFSATINGHKFSELRATSSDCTLKVRLRFTAPKDKYTSGAPRRNYYRFKARLELSDNITVDSPVFGNRAAGRRVYTFQHDSTGQRCWAKQEHKVRNVDIEGCRGRGCRVEPFD